MNKRRWKDIKDRERTPQQLGKLDALVAEELLELTLRELREALGKTQVELASLVATSQAQLSRVESRNDHLISTVRAYVEALGGELEVVAKIDGKRIVLHGV
jgi:predicted transcriptional regulator